MDRERGHLTKDYKAEIHSIEWVKMVAVGDTQTGKTSLIKVICQNMDDEINDYIPTVGVDYGFKIQDVDEKKDYFEVRRELYTGTDILLLMFDVTRPETLSNLSNWLNEVTEFLKPPDQCPVMGVLANKIDLNNDRRVSVMEGKQWSLGNKLKYFETSAVRGIGIDKMMVDLVKNVLEYRKKKAMETK